MPFGSDKTPRICLVTGPPGCGKTTLIRQVAASLPGARLAGFITEEIREAGKRQGFTARNLSGLSCVMAHRTIRSSQRVSAYGVDVAAFDRVVVGPLESAADPDLYVIDEIGKMELKSARFLRFIRTVINGPKPLLATIPIVSLPIVTELGQRSDTLLVHAGKLSQAQAGKVITEWLIAMGFTPIGE